MSSLNIGFVFSYADIWWEANDPDYSQVHDVPPRGLFGLLGGDVDTYCCSRL